MALRVGEYPPVFSAVSTGRIVTGAAAAASVIGGGIGMLRLTAPSTNTAPVYFGHDNTVSAANGVPIEAGTEKFVFIDDGAKLFLYSAAAQSIAYEAYR